MEIPTIGKTLISIISRYIFQTNEKGMCVIIKKSLFEKSDQDVKHFKRLFVWTFDDQYNGFRSSSSYFFLQQIVVIGKF